MHLMAECSNSWVRPISSSMRLHGGQGGDRENIQVNTSPYADGHCRNIRGHKQTMVCFTTWFGYFGLSELSIELWCGPNNRIWDLKRRFSTLSTMLIMRYFFVGLSPKLPSELVS